MNVKNTIEAIVCWVPGRYFVITPNGNRWCITEEDVEHFALTTGLNIVISTPDPQDQFCKVEYVVPATEVFNRQFEEWQGNSDGSVGLD